MIERLIALIRKQLLPDCRAKRIKDIIFDLLHPEYGQAKALELASSYTPKVKKRLDLIYMESFKKGENCWFEFNSVSDDVIQGPCFVEPKDTPEIREAKIKRLKSASMAKVLEQITFQDFELICAALLYLLGARNYRKTIHSKDQGIDFYGKLILGDLYVKDFPFFRFEDHLELWLVGQAKHYVHGKVGAPEIRNLVGSVNLARFKEYASTSELMSGMPLRSCDPVFVLFLTTGLFSRDAERLAQNSGVITKNINDIANFLVDKAVGLDETDNPSNLCLVEWAKNVLRINAGI